MIYASRYVPFMGHITHKPEYVSQIDMMFFDQGSLLVTDTIR